VPLTKVSSVWGHKMGKGYMKFANNSVYVGDFTNDKPHGQGMMQLSD
jgi:hypothetical protein